MEPEDDTSETAPHGPSLRRLLAVLLAVAGVLLLLVLFATWFVPEKSTGPNLERSRSARPVTRREQGIAGAASDLTKVRCPIGHALDGWEGLRVEQLVEDGEDRELAVLPFEIVGTDLVLEYQAPEGVAALHWGLHRNRGRAMFTWETDRTGVHCAFNQPLPEARNASLLGRVDGAAQLPEGAVSLEGCGATLADVVGADGSFFLATTAEGCRMRAWRASGMLRVPGPWVAVTPQVGREVEVTLTVPTWEPAGLGVNIRPDAEGMRITYVHAGTPAEAAGLLDGDVVLTVGGVPTEGMDLDAFLQVALGPAGSDLELEVLGVDGETEIVTVRRQLLERRPAEE